MNGVKQYIYVYIYIHMTHIGIFIQYLQEFELCLYSCSFTQKYIFFIQQLCKQRLTSCMDHDHSQINDSLNLNRLMTYIYDQPRGLEVRASDY